jgi:hypothetical protein
MTVMAARGHASTSLLRYKLTMRLQLTSHEDRHWVLAPCASPMGRMVLLVSFQP